MYQLTPEVLKALMPRCVDPAGWTPALQAAMNRFGISSNTERVRRFLAQIAVESGELTRLEESLNYSAERLLVIWPKRFPSREFAVNYAHAPHKLADYVYGNRMGNGPPESGDGWKYRGRGPKMVTGADNYRWLGKELQLPLFDCPDQLLTKATGCLAAALFWNEKGLNELADDTPDDDQDADYVTITLRINGGTVGLAQRQMYLRRAEVNIT
jgi:putative chitinase